MGTHMEKKLQSGTVRIDIQSGFPWNGNVSIRVECEAEETFTIALRIPDWGQDYKITGECGSTQKEKNGYLYLTKAWKSDTIQIEFPMEVQVIESDSRVRETVGKAAVQRGPVVYCLEEADNGKDLHLLKMDENAQFETQEKQIATESVIALRAQGWKQRQRAQDGKLYFAHTKTEYERTTLTWIPYYAWANRGEGEMQVWTRI